MKTTRLGATALEISEISFGGIPIIPLPQDEAVSVVRHCFDQGITFFDTANMYLTSEEKLGVGLKPIRSKVVIATKTVQRDGKGAADHLDLFLRQFQTDRIDVYQLHNVSNADTLKQVLAPHGAYEAVSKAHSRRGRHRLTRKPPLVRYQPRQAHAESMKPPTNARNGFQVLRWPPFTFCPYR